MKGQNGYVITGTAPWVCGKDIFEKLFVGFNLADDIIFALIDFPNQENAKTKLHDLVCLMGSNTVEIQFQDFFIVDELVVQIRNRSDIKQGPRATQ